MICFPLIFVYAIYEAVRFIITTNHAALRFALSALLLAVLIDWAGRLLLTPLWHKSLAELDHEIAKAEEELAETVFSFVSVAGSKCRSS